MKNKKTWLYLLLAVFNILCAMAIILLCMRGNVEAQDLEKEIQTAKENYEELTSRVEETEQKVKTEQALGAQAEAAALNVQKEETQPAADQKQESKEAGKTVALDPGHQGAWVDMSALEPNGPGSSELKAKCSTGTEGTYSGLTEYQLNLDVSLKLKGVLESRGYRVVMTRTDNEAAVSNAERAQFAYNQGADIYVRIHANGDENNSVNGTLTIGPSPDNPYVGQLCEQSQRLCQNILDAYCEKTGFMNRGVQHYDNMTGINWSQIPVTIVEMGFMTSEQDDLKMADTVFQQTMAEGIADGIDRYFS